MPAPTLDARLVYDAIAAILAPVLPAGVNVYAHGKVPATLPAKWVLLTVERTLLAPAHGARVRTRSAWRVYVRPAADTSRNAEGIANDCAVALEDVRLLVAGATSTPVAHDSTEAVRPDDGKFSGMTSYTFTF